jgi:hypothetical protein
VAIDHKGNRSGSAPEYLRRTFREYIRLLVLGKAPLVIRVSRLCLSFRGLSKIFSNGWRKRLPQCAAIWQHFKPTGPGWLKSSGGPTCGS